MAGKSHICVSRESIEGRAGPRRMSERDTVAPNKPNDEYAANPWAVAPNKAN